MINNLHPLVHILNQGASSDLVTVDSLASKIGIALPLDYKQYLAYKRDIEFSIAQSYVRIWDATGCLEMNEAYHVNEQLPHALAIGDDGGGGFFIYMRGKNGFGLYYCRMADLDRNEAIKIADSLTSLLVDGQGITKLRDILAPL